MAISVYDTEASISLVPLMFELPHNFSLNSVAGVSS